MSRFQISEVEYEAIKVKEKETQEKRLSKRLRNSFAPWDSGMKYSKH